MIITPAATGRPAVQELQRVLAVARVQALVWPRQFGLPLGLIVLGLTLVVVGKSVVGRPGTDGLEIFLPGTPLTLFYCAVLATVHHQTVAQMFSFAVGLGVTRRTFALATALVVVVQGVVVGVVLVLLAQVERATDGWGAGQQLIGDDERTAIELLAAYATFFVLFAAVGVLSGAVVQRWGPSAIWAVFLPGFVLLFTLFYLLGAGLGRWTATGAVSVVLAPVLGLTGYAVLRRATP